MSRHDETGHPDHATRCDGCGCSMWLGLDMQRRSQEGAMFYCDDCTESGDVIGDALIVVDGPHLGPDPKVQQEVLWLNPLEFLYCELPLVYDYAEAAEGWANVPSWHVWHEAEDPDEVWDLALMEDEAFALAAKHGFGGWAVREYDRNAARDRMREPLS